MNLFSCLSLIEVVPPLKLRINQVISYLSIRILILFDFLHSSRHSFFHFKFIFRFLGRLSIDCLLLQLLVPFLKVVRLHDPFILFWQVAKIIIWYLIILVILFMFDYHPHASIHPFFLKFCRKNAFVFAGPQNVHAALGVFCFGQTLHTPVCCSHENIVLYFVTQ